MILEIGKLLGIDPGQNDVGSETVNQQKEECIENSDSQIFNLENIPNGLDKVFHIQIVAVVPP